MAGCGSKADEKTDDTAKTEATDNKGSDEEETEIQVFIAASLKNVMDELAAQYNEEHPNVKLTYNADSSGTLLTQIEEGYECDIEYNGTKAMERIGQNHIDLILLDIMLTDVDGLTLCQRTREISNVPIMFLSAKDDVETKVAGLDMGGNDYLTKPFNMEILDNRIHHLLALQQKRKQIFLTEIEVNTEDLTTSKVDEEFLKKAVAFVEKNLDNNDYSVELFSDDMCMSRMNLYRKLQSITGQKPTEFIRSIRLKKAARLLTDTDLSIVEISEKVGFATPSYFSKCFKEMFGVLPTQYHK